jgi:EAL domain-containing protein (putative c-di-GMP-specific phosphodiesterase class I)/CheY-like chemotaxis protein
MGVFGIPSFAIGMRIISMAAPAAESPSQTNATLEDIVEAPTLAPSTGTGPLCYVVDEDSSIRQFLSLVLHGSGIDSVEFADGAALRQSAEKRTPDLIFHDVALDSADAVESMTALGARGFRGPVQLTSSRGGAVLDHVKNIGLARKLNMLPVLKKPYETEAVIKIIQGLKLGMAAATAPIELDQALANNWIEFWYQPKIDLRRKQLAGVEASSRARHPQHGIASAAAYIPGASEASVVRLSELALSNALKAGDSLCRLGVNIPVTVNIHAAALGKLPIEDIVQAHHRAPDQWPGLIIDIREKQIIADLRVAAEVGKRLEPHNVRLAIDESGQAFSALAQFGETPFAEIKIDRALVADCATDKAKLAQCKAMIDLAHGFQRHAVGLEIEKTADARTLLSLGCDYGQGVLFGQPMPEARLIALLRQRSAAPAR